jgi:phosphoribosylaminoimidazole carboxylase (NCAIR synthetase)
MMTNSEGKVIAQWVVRVPKGFKLNGATEECVYYLYENGVLVNETYCSRVNNSKPYSIEECRLFFNHGLRGIVLEEIIEAP